MTQLFIIAGTFFAFCGVLARSLSSHAIKPTLEELGKLDNFNIAADYLLFHGLALIATAILCHIFPQSRFQWAGWAFILGSVLFQGTVIFKAFIPMGPAGLLTPLGGFVLLGGWLLLGYGALRIANA